MDKITLAYLKCIGTDTTEDKKAGKKKHARRLIGEQVEPTYHISFYYQDWNDDVDNGMMSGDDVDEYEKAFYDYHDMPLDDKPFHKAFVRYGGKTDGVPHDQGEITGENAGDYNYIYNFDAITAQDLFDMLRDEDVGPIPFIDGVDVVEKCKTPQALVAELMSSLPEERDSLISIGQN